MADRYWVGGSGNWDATSTANWAASSGGTAGASAPTSADNVIFDAASNVGTGAFTVTVTGTSSAPAVCADFSTGGAGGALDGAMTLSLGATADLSCYGSMTLPATNFSISGTSGALIAFRATTTGKTFTTNGVSFGNVQVAFSGVGGSWTLGSAFTSTLNSSSAFRIIAGTFDTGNYNITCSGFDGSGTTTRTITLGSSTLTLSNTTAAFTFGTAPSNLTFNAGTSQITCSAASPTFNGGGLTFYNVTFSSAASGTTTINGANTFNNLTQTSRSATGQRIVELGADQTVSGTLTLGAANTAIRRIHVNSTVIGTQRTITLNGTLATLADVDFRDIVAAGTAGTWTGTRIGNGLNNSGITFTAAKTVYWNLAGSQNWSATGWATTNNGTPAVNNFPLAQDTAVFTEAGSAGTVTWDAQWWIGNIQMADGVSNRTTAFTLATSTTNPRIYGSVTLFSNLTLTGTGTLNMYGYGVTQIFTSAGISIPQSITVNAVTGTFQLADNLTNTGTAFTLTAGTLDLSSGNRTLTCVTFSSSNSNTRSIAFGTGNITITGNNATVWTTATSTGFTYTGTPTVNFNYSGSVGTRTVSNHTTGGTESNALSYNFTAGTDTVTISTSGVAKNVSYSGFSGTGNLTGTMYGNLVLGSGMTVVAATSGTTFAATSGTQQITTNGVSIDRPLTVNAPGATVQLQDNLTIGSTRTFTLTAGTLDLSSGNMTLSTGLFSSSNSNTRSIAFGTGQIDVTGNDAIVCSTSIATNFTYTGTSKINFTYSGSTGTRTISHGNSGGATESNSLNYFFTSGTDIIALGGNSTFRTLDFTGFSGTLNNNTRTIYGNLTISSGMTLTAGIAVTTFAATSGTQNITSAGKTIDFPVTINAPGATVQLQDDLTMAATRDLTHTAGTLNLNGKTLTEDSYSVSGTTTRVLAFGVNGTLSLRNSGTVFSNTTTSGWSTTGTGKITLTSSSAKTFAGNGANYTCGLNQGGSGDLTITGANTFGDISNSVQPCKIIFPANTTTNVKAFTLRGLPGNNVTIESSTAGQQFTLNYTT